MLEALLCLPLLLLASLGAGQFAHLWLCRQVVHYAANTAARAALPMSAQQATWLSGIHRSMTEEEIAALEAARQVCALVSFTQPSDAHVWAPVWFPMGINGSGGVTDAGKPQQADVPSWEASDASLSRGGWRVGKLAVAVATPSTWTRQVTVAMDVPLLFPFAGPVIGRIFQLFDSSGSLSFDAPEEGLDPDNNGAVGVAYDGVFPHFRLRETAVIVKPFVVSTIGNLPENFDSY